MPTTSRREFLKSSAAASTAFGLFTISGTKASGKVIGANDTIRIGVAGIHGQGKYHIKGFAGQKNVEVAYLADPDSRWFDTRSAFVTDAGGRAPKCVGDPREMFDAADIDAVSIATPNHWHTLLTIWACQAGKDVYVEKPLSHNVSEGRLCIEAATKYNRIVQHGTQSRSNHGRANEIAAVQSGDYGKLIVSKGYCCKARWSIGEKPVTSPPSELDFDLWLGPAPKLAYHDNLVPYNWHWFWPTGNGDIGNQGVHQLDVARWAIKDSTLPTRVWSLGGRFGYADQGVTPNMQLAVFEYGDVYLVFEVRGLVQKHDKFPRKVDNEYYTTEGVIMNGRFRPAGGGKSEKLKNYSVRVTPGNRYGSFIRALRSRKQEDINATVEDGHYSSALCHLANISYRLGREVPFDHRTQSLGDNKEILDSFNDIQENLIGVGVELKDKSYQLGADLQFDPQTERFVDNPEADKMLTREYRKGYEVSSDMV